MFFGALLLVLGALMLLQQVGIIRGGIWEYFWPVAIIALGVTEIYRSKNHSSK